MNSHLPCPTWTMCIGEEDGCSEVPEAIAPMNITFWSCGPTRMAILSPDVTRGESAFMEPPSIPGIFIGVCSDGDGDAWGMDMPGMFGICPGEGFGVGDGDCD